ncbi:carbohydrate-binding module family 13 protein [Rhizophagus irregularis DAOM 181602=DAOM 197198]|nr:carbohydrate-binding module family 13 protein [Rhizophagus irregularis DAOM 181602=DAOM 197198]
MSEVQVWKNVLKWGHAQNPELSSDPASLSKDDFNVLKNTLQHCIPFIRFYNLTSKEISDTVIPYRDILPEELYVDVLRTLLNLHPDSMSIIKSKPRKSINVDSNIITFKHAELISRWIDKLSITDKLTSSYEFKLILRGTRDGFAPSKFHEICDGKSCTVSIIKSVDSIEKHILSHVKNEQFAVFNLRDCGPLFGEYGDDLTIKGLDKSYSNKRSYKKRIRKIEDRFFAKEYEVFQIMKKG